jgi:hypothetical protein
MPADAIVIAPAAAQEKSRPLGCCRNCARKLWYKGDRTDFYVHYYERTRPIFYFGIVRLNGDRN